VPKTTSLVRFASVGQLPPRVARRPLRSRKIEPPSTHERVVLNISYTADELLGAVTSPIIHLHGQETVYIFRCITPFRGLMANQAEAEQAVRTLLRELVQRLTHGIQRPECTRTAIVVGVEELLSVPQPEGLSHQRNEERLRGAEAHYRDRQQRWDNSLPPGQTFHTRLRHMTLKEYREMVGPERAALETTGSATL
jgi:hypothetical protein